MNGIRDKLRALAALEAEHRFGVTLDTRPPRLASMEGAPEAFTLYRELGGSYLTFGSPLEVHEVAEWENREVVDPYDIGPSLGVGGFWPTEDLFLDLVCYRLDTGLVYFGDADHLGYYAHEEDVPVVCFAPDATTFVDECILGQGYVDVLAQCGGLRFIRKGRLKGQPADNWLRLLVAAGLADPEIVRTDEELTVVVRRSPRDD